MEKEIRSLIAEYGVKGVYETLQKIMHDDLEALKRIMEKRPAESEEVKREKKPVTKANAKQAPPITPPPEEDQDDEPIREETISTLMQKAGKGAQIVIQKMSSSEKPSFSTLKEAKAWQKEQEEIRRKQLEDQGVTPQSLLTKENLTKWIQEERKGYSVIAREYVGLSEAQVAAAAKEFGIKSIIGRPPKA